MHNGRRRWIIGFLLLILLVANYFIYSRFERTFSDITTKNGLLSQSSWNNRLSTNQETAPKPSREQATVESELKSLQKLGVEKVIPNRIPAVRDIFLIHYRNASNASLVQWIPWTDREINFYIVIPHIDYAYCPILKNAHTITAYAYCSLADPREPRVKDRHEHIVKCRDCCSIEAKSLDNKNKRRFIVTRDPIDRFVSGFMHLCWNAKRCYDCRNDVACVIKRNFQNLLHVSEHGTLHGLNQSMTQKHFFPQTWTCDLSPYSSRPFYLMRYEHGNRFKNKFVRFLKEVNATSSDLKRAAEVLFRQKIHETATDPFSDKMHRVIDTTPELRQILVRTYLIDYLLLNYPLPYGLTLADFQLD